MTPKAQRSIILAGVLLVLLAASAQAVFYTVTLKNGTTFETRYRPVQAEWDANVSMFMTDRGNWIAVDNRDIADVTSVLEETGFGYQLDTTTKFIGWTPNDLKNDQTDERGNPIGGERYDVEADQTGEDVGGDYSIDQFLSISTSPGYGNPTSGGGGVPIISGPIGDQVP